MSIDLKFKSYDDYMSLDYYQNEDNIVKEAEKYIMHKKANGGVYKYNGYPGVTSVQSMMMPEEQIYLEKWKKKLIAQGLDPDVVGKNYADIGTAVHYAIECKISPTFIKPPEWTYDEYPDKCQEMVGKGMYMWNLLTEGANPALTINNVKCEVFCKNEKYRYSGFYDLYANINNKMTIADFKTSPSCKDKYLLQLGAYSMYFNKMPEQGMIINVCPDDRNPMLRPLVTILDAEQLETARLGWIEMITAFHDIFDPYLPVTDSKHDAPLRNSIQENGGSV